MKKYNLALVLVVMASINLFSQDIIVLRNGDEIKAKVNEVGQSEIKYNKFDNLTGPVYSIKKSEVFMIRYENGSKDVFQEEEKPQVVKSEKQSPIISDSRIRKARTASTVGYLLVVPIMGFGVASASADTFEEGIPLGAAATIIGAVGIPLVASAGRRLRNEANVDGNRGLRIAGWVSYGLAVGDAIVLLAASGEGIDTSSATVPVAVLGSLASILMAIDVHQTATQAEALQSKSMLRRISPYVGATRDQSGKSIPTIGFKIKL